MTHKWIKHYECPVCGEMYPSEREECGFCHTPMEIHGRGRWVWDPDGMDWGLGAWKCSECHVKAETWWATDPRDPKDCSCSRYCGNCGVRKR